MNTLHQFTIAIDKGDSTGFASLFTSDGTLELAKTGQLAKGEAELSAYCTNAWELHKGAQHVSLNHALSATEDPNTVINESYWQIFSEGVVTAMGLYADILERQANGSWLFVSRKVVQRWSKEDGNEQAGGVWDGMAIVV